MPAHNRSGGDQDEGLLPSGPHPPQHHPEQLMYGSQSTARSLDVQSQQLLTQSEVFEDKALSREESRANPSDEMPERCDHGRNFTGTLQIGFFVK
jgi:hypothetical protein